MPAAPRRTPHFHFNLLPIARKVATTRALTDTFLRYLTEHGEKAVYGQMTTFEDRRGVKMFERYGFKVVSRCEITKYRDLHPEPVYLCTVVKNLEESAQLYAKAG